MSDRYQWSTVGADQADLMHYDSYTQTLSYVRGFSSKAGLSAAVAGTGASRGAESESSPPSSTQPPVTRALDALRAGNDADVFTFSRQQMNALTDAARYVCLLGSHWLADPPPPPPPGE
jgi:hypothetical protein